MIYRLILILLLFAAPAYAQRVVQVLPLQPRARGTYALPEVNLVGWQGVRLELQVPNDPALTLKLTLEASRDCKTWFPYAVNNFRGGPGPTRMAPWGVRFPEDFPACIRGSVGISGAATVGATMSAIRNP